MEVDPACTSRHRIPLLTADVHDLVAVQHDHGVAARGGAPMVSITVARVRTVTSWSVGVAGRLVPSRSGMDMRTPPVPDAVAAIDTDLNSSA